MPDPIEQMRGHMQRREFIMQRREFITAVGGWVVAWPAAYASAAGGRPRRIGVLFGATLDPTLTDAFESGLRDLDWRIGQDITIEYRTAEGHFDRLPSLAAELVNLKVELILAVSAPETSAAKGATRSIPIVFAGHGNPIGTGDVQSLARPGGNITGLSQMHPELSRKQLELLKECIPGVSRVAVFWNSANPAKAQDWYEMNLAAQKLGIVLDSREVRSPADLDGILSTTRTQRPDALITLGDPLTFTLRATITNLALELRLPAMYPFRPFVDIGGLMSYGADLGDLFRRAAGYVDKIFKGAKPSDLPVEQPTKFEFVINLKTAKVLGLELPATLLARADEVIE
jgi:putative ABC transport system substrate-binding protein